MVGRILPDPSILCAAFCPHHPSKGVALPLHVVGCFLGTPPQACCPEKWEAGAPSSCHTGKGAGSATRTPSPLRGRVALSRICSSGQSGRSVRILTSVLAATNCIKSASWWATTSAHGTKRGCLVFRASSLRPSEGAARLRRRLAERLHGPRAAPRGRAGLSWRKEGPGTE